MVLKDTKAFRILQESSENMVNSEMQKWMDQGGKVIGYMCSSIPDEIITAAGLFPHRVRAAWSNSTELADEFIAPICCGFGRHGLNMGLKGDYKFYDGLIFANNCDVTRRLYDTWQKYLKDKPGFQHNLALPRHRRPQQVEWFHDEMVMLRDHMENYFDVTITDQKIWDAIKLHNRKRKLQRKLYDLRKQENPPINGAEVLTVMIAGSALPVERYNQVLSELIEQIRGLNGHADSRLRLLIEGSMLDNPSYIEAIESQGAIVVTDFMCFGTRNMWFDINEELSDPLRAISQYYIHDRLSCPRMMEDQERRSAAVIEMCNDFKVDGVVGLRIPFCDNWGVEEYMLGRRLAEKNIPHLRMDREYTVSGLGQIATRAQAFLEMIREVK